MYSNRLIILLALLIGVLYSLHLLVKDYQTLTASRLRKLLFKRDVRLEHMKTEVRWNRILQYDSAQCARYLYCELGARPTDNEVGRGFVYMLTLEADNENKPAWEVFSEAFKYGAATQSRINACRQKYSCPFRYHILLNFISFMVRDGNVTTS